MKVVKKVRGSDAEIGDVSRQASQQVNNSASDSQSYVRVTKIDSRGYVEFQFSIGDPNLYLEMALPRAAFDEFCETQQAQHLTREQERAVDQTELRWRYGDSAADEQVAEDSINAKRF